MKICSRCKVEKNESEFCANKSKRDGLSSYCKVCKAQQVREYYNTHPEYRKQSKVRAKRRKQRLLVKIYQYLLTHPCVDCGEKDVIVLDLDHRDPKQKDRGVTEMARNHSNWKKIEREIAKCDVRCANCHRRRTAKQFDGYSALEEAKRGLLIDSDVSVS